MNVKDKVLEIAKDIKSQAERILLNSESLHPIAFIVTPTYETILIPAAFETAEEKHVLYSKICKFGKSKNAIGAISVNEAWMSLNLHSVPSEDPQRQEVLIITAMGRNFSSGWIVPFTRKGHDVVFGEEIDTDEDHSIENNLLKDMFTYDA